MKKGSGSAMALVWLTISRRAAAIDLGGHGDRSEAAIVAGKVGTSSLLFAPLTSFFPFFALHSDENTKNRLFGRLLLSPTSSPEEAETELTKHVVLPHVPPPNVFPLRCARWRTRDGVFRFHGG